MKIVENYRLKNHKKNLKPYIKMATSFPAHLFAIRGRQKRGPGTLQTRD